MVQYANASSLAPLFGLSRSVRKRARDTHSVDLRLADEVVVPQDDGVAAIDFSRAGPVAQFIHRNSRLHKITREQPFRLAPHQFVLARTIERVGLPIPANGDTCLAARIEGKSSRARFGLLIHFTAPTVHPGFDGTLTLEMINLGPWPIDLSPGMARSPQSIGSRRK